jgi:hypothetical protein
LEVAIGLESLRHNFPTGFDPFPGRHHPVVGEARLEVARGSFLRAGGSVGTIRGMLLFWTELVVLK